MNIHIQEFNSKVSAMNQMNKPDLRLTRHEANSLLSDITMLLTQISNLSAQLNSEQSNVIEVEIDGGSFR